MKVEKKLSAIDAKILKELLRDGRKSFKEIAKECNLSCSAISDHYKELVKAGIVVGATTQFNATYFGFEGVATIQFNVESQHLDEVFERLRKIDTILTQRQFNVKHNIMVITRWKNPRDLDVVKETIRRLNPVIECKTHLWTDVRNTPENLTLGFPPELNETSEKNNEINLPPKDSFKVDATDLKILHQLTVNGRLPFRKIAKELELSTGTVSQRYERLKKNHLLKVSIQINPAALGYNSVVDFSLGFTSNDNMSSTIEKLLQIPDVSYIVKVEGDFDLHVAALAKNLSGVFAINEQIAKIPNIKKLEAALRKPPPAWPSAGQHISTFGNEKL